MNWVDNLLNTIFNMEDKRISCTNCKYGEVPYEGTDEVRPYLMEISDEDLLDKKCPKCEEKTLIEK